MEVTGRHLVAAARAAALAGSGAGRENSEARGRAGEVSGVRGSRFFGRAAAGVGAGALVIASLGAPAGAGTAQVVPSDAAVALSDPGITLTTPHDGRIRGFDFSARVTGAAFSYSAGPGGDAVSAPSGDYLCVFGLSVNDLNGSDPIPDFAAVAIVGDRRIPLDVSALKSGGTGTFAVAVPRGAKVGLELAGQNLAQDYSLSDLVLEGPAPTVLYRDPDGPVVNLDVQANQSLAFTIEDLPGGQGVVPLSVSTVALTYFNPDTGAPPADGTAKAFLVPTLASNRDQVHATDSSQYGSNLVVDPFTALTGSDLSIVLPDGTAIPATHTGETSRGASLGSDSGLVEGSYYFEVPADITDVKLVVKPAPNQVGLTQILDTGTANADIAPATFSLSFPAPVAMGAPGPRLVIPAVAHGPLGVGPTGTGGTLLLLVLLAALVVAGLLAYRRLRRRPSVERVFVRIVVEWESGQPRFAAMPMGELPWAHPAGPSAPLALPTPVIDLSDERIRPAVDVSANGKVPERWSDAAVEINVVGGVELWGVVHTDSEPLVRLLVLLGTHLDDTRPLSEDLTRAGIAGRRVDPGAASLRTYTSSARKLLPGVVRLLGRGGYRLEGEVACDWVELRRRGEAARRADGPRRRELYASALALVRGRPFADLIWAGVENAASDMAVYIATLAEEAAALAIDDGDAAGAEKAAAIGLIALDTSQVLWGHRLRAAAAGSGLGLETVWTLAQDKLKDDARDLQPLYVALRAALARAEP